MLSNEIDYRVLSERITRARKAHACSLCRDPIEPGSLYSRTAYLADGQFHFECHHGGICPSDHPHYTETDNGNAS